MDTDTRIRGALVLGLAVALTATACAAGGRMSRGSGPGASAARSAQRVERPPPELTWLWGKGVCGAELQNLSFRYERDPITRAVVGQGDVSVDDYLALADCLREQGVEATVNGRELLRQARRFYRRVLELDPNHVYAMHGIASIYLYQTRQNRMSVFRSLKQDFREPMSKAVVTLREAFKAQPEEPLTWFYLGQVEALRGDWEGALKRFDQVAAKKWEVESRMSDFRAWRGLALEQLGRRGDAHKEWHKAVEIDETFSAAEWAWDKVRVRSWHFHLGLLGTTLATRREDQEAVLADEYNDLRVELAGGYFFTRNLALQFGATSDLPLRDLAGIGGHATELRLGPWYSVSPDPVADLYVRSPLSLALGRGVGVAPGAGIVFRPSKYSEHSGLSLGVEAPFVLLGDRQVMLLFVAGYNWFF